MAGEQTKNQRVLAKNEHIVPQSKHRRKVSEEVRYFQRYHPQGSHLPHNKQSTTNAVVRKQTARMWQTNIQTKAHVIARCDTRAQPYAMVVKHCAASVANTAVLRAQWTRYLTLANRANQQAQQKSGDPSHRGTESSEKHISIALPHICSTNSSQCVLLGNTCIST